MSKGGLLYHFRSKEVLVEGLCDRMFGALRRGARSALDRRPRNRRLLDTRLSGIDRDRRGQTRGQLGSTHGRCPRDAGTRFRPFGKGTRALRALARAPRFRWYRPGSRHPRPAGRRRSLALRLARPHSTRRRDEPRCVARLARSHARLTRNRHALQKLRLRDRWRRLRGLRAGQPPQRRSATSSAVARGGTPGRLVGRLDPHARSARHADRQPFLRLGLPLRTRDTHGGAPDLPRARQAARRVEQHQRHDLPARQRGRLRRLGAAPGPRAVELCALPALLQKNGSLDRRR